MSTSLKRWDVQPRAPETHFAQFPDLPALIVQILYNRGFTQPQEVQQFLTHGWTDDAPLGLKGMAEAVARLAQAIAGQELMAVYGDYDVDGVTATTLMTQALTALGGRVQAYIPNRFDEGYGLNNEALAELAERGVKLVLTVDCGIRSVKEVAYGNSLGLDIIITDHHHVGDETPPALAAINPKQPGCTYGFKDLAGVGLAYKLVQALLDQVPSKGLRAADFLDLVALGTIADLAPLYGENRKLAQAGLTMLNRSLRPGLAVLMGKIGAKPVISAGTIGFAIGPRLNAAGRLDSALAAYQLLMAATEFEAIHLATQLDLQNRERQKLTQQTVDTARESIVADGGRSPLYFIHHDDFNPGIVGLAASRLSEEFYRPVLVAERGPQYTKGSARSIPEFHITEALDQCADLLVRYGGHAAAAGFTVANEHVLAFQARLLEVACQRLDPAALRPVLTVDAEINLRGVKPDLVEAITRLQPFGYGNPTPSFLTRGLTIKSLKTMGQDNQHLRLALHDGKQVWSAVAFRHGHWAGKLRPAQLIDVAYTLDFNDWNGERRMQLEIKDLRPREET